MLLIHNAGYRKDNKPMEKQSITEYMKSHFLYFDGAMGTMVQRHGLKAGEAPEVFSLSHPEVIADIHRSYLQAGATVITANTFGANAHKLAVAGLKPPQVIAASVGIARQAAGDNAYVALDIGPIGELLEPMGTLSFDDAYEIFKEEAVAGEQAGADLVLIETMSDLYEIKAAILAVKENTQLPVFVTLTVQENGRTYTGCDIASFAVLAESLGVAAVGLNCSLGPVQMLPHVKKLLSLTELPVMFQPNAGLPRVEDGVTCYDVTSEQFGLCQKEAAESGVSIVGGCCGTTPEHIEAVVRHTAGIVPVARVCPKQEQLCVPTAAISFDDSTVIANQDTPSESLQAEFAAYDTAGLIDLALDAADEGAEVFNINVAADGIDEAKMMKTAVKELQELCRLPFMLTTSNPQALEAGLRCFNGRAAVNIPDVPALTAIAARYGAVLRYQK